MNDRFGFSRKERREAREGRQNAVEKDIREKAKGENMPKVDRYDSKIFEQGANWFNEGMNLEDAPESVRNNSNFIRGYDRAKRLALIVEMQNSQANNNTRGSR